MKTPNEKFGVFVNIFSTYDEIRVFCFCSKKRTPNKSKITLDTNLCIFVVRFRATKRCDFSTALKGMSYIQGL